MQTCKILACCLLMILSPVGMMDLGNVMAAQDEGTRDDIAADEPDPSLKKSKKVL